MERIVIIGASKNRDKFGNKAVKAYLKKGYRVYPVNPKEDEIEGIKCYHSISEINDDVKTASIYVPAEIGAKVISKVHKFRNQLFWSSSNHSTSRIIFGFIQY